MWICIVLIQGDKENLIKFANLSAKTLKSVKCLRKILFNTDLMVICLLPCFYILFRRQLKSVKKVIIPEEFLGKPQSFRAYRRIVNI